MAGHQRYERMAVGHVLGGLDDIDAGAFRGHLVDCRTCRQRVTELREISTSLEATEREERAAATGGTTEVRQRAEEHAPPRVIDVAPWRSWPWRVVVVGLVPLLVLTLLAWAVWIRAENDMLRAVAATQQQALEVMADGHEVTWTSPVGVRGSVAADDERVALNLSNLPAPQPDEAIVVWLLNADGGVSVVSGRYLAGQLVGNRLVTVVERSADVVEVLVTVEVLPNLLQRPGASRIVTGRL